MHIDIHVEDSSGARLMEILLPKLLGPCGDPHTWKIRSSKGIGRIPPNMTNKVDASKKTLLENLRRLLQGYGKTPGHDAVFVVLDSDKRNVLEFEQELLSFVNECTGAPLTKFGIATEEIEAWYLGDRVALHKAYPKCKTQALKKYQQDSVCGTWELLADALVPGGSKAVKKAGWTRAGALKHEWAENIGPHMRVQSNQSPSFAKAQQELLSLLG